MKNLPRKPMPNAHKANSRVPEVNHRIKLAEKRKSFDQAKFIEPLQISTDLLIENKVLRNLTTS